MIPLPVMSMVMVKCAYSSGSDRSAKVGAGVSKHLLVVSYFFFETNPPLLLVGLHVEATTGKRTAHF